MSDQDIELDDDSVLIDETIDEEQEPSSDDDNDTETKRNSNQSNFKALYKKTKQMEAELKAEREARFAEQEELRQWRELNEGTAKEIDTSKDINSLKEEIFTAKNPDAEPHLLKIRETMSKYNMDYKEAWKFVKVDLPQESVTKKEFDISNKAPAKRKDLSQVTAEEALLLPKEEREKWRKINGWEL